MEKDDVKQSQKSMNGCKIEPIKGTMKMHLIFAVDDIIIAHRETSYFCDDCFHEDKLMPGCPGWKQSALTVKEVCS